MVSGSVIPVTFKRRIDMEIKSPCRGCSGQPSTDPCCERKNCPQLAKFKAALDEIGLADCQPCCSPLEYSTYFSVGRGEDR